MEWSSRKVEWSSGVVELPSKKVKWSSGVVELSSRKVEWSSGVVEWSSITPKSGKENPKSGKVFPHILYQLSIIVLRSHIA